DLGPGQDLPRLAVHGDDHDDHALLGQRPPVPQDTVADVANGAVDVQVAGRHLARPGDAVVVEGDDVAVLAQQHLRLVDAHPHGEPGVVDEVTVLAVHGDESFRPGHGQHGLQLRLLAVTAGVDLGLVGVDHLGTQPVQAVDHLGHRPLVARNGVGTD